MGLFFQITRGRFAPKKTVFKNRTRYDNLCLRCFSGLPGSYPFPFLAGDLPSSSTHPLDLPHPPHPLDLPPHLSHLLSPTAERKPNIQHHSPDKF